MDEQENNRLESVVEFQSSQVLISKSVSSLTVREGLIVRQALPHGRATDTLQEVCCTARLLTPARVNAVAGDHPFPDHDFQLLTLISPE